MDRRVALLLVVGLCVTPLAVVGAETPPRFEAHVPEPTLTPGATQPLTIDLVNDGENADDTAQTARDVRVRVRSKGPIEVRSGERLLDPMADGERRSIQVDVTVPGDAAPGTYRLPVRVTHDYAEQSRETDTVYATVRVAERARFRVVDTDADVGVGGTGTVTVTVENVGSVSANATRLTLASENTALRVGDGTASSRYLGRVAPGERRSVAYAVGVSETAAAQPYAASVRAAFEGPDGIETTAAVDTVGVTPSPEAAFALRALDSTLRVGREGAIRGTLVNEGDRPVRNAVVVVETPSASVRLTEATYPLGDLPAGEGASFSVPARVARWGEAGPRAFTATVRYETSAGDAHRSDPLAFRRPVEPERDRVALEPVNATADVDASNRVTVRLTNVGNETLEDVDATLAPRAPFTSAAPESYVGTLEPGESALLHFEVSVAEDAVANTHAVPVNVTATVGGDPVRSGPHLVPVTVSEPPAGQNDTATLAAGVVLVLVVLGAGWWWLRR